MDQAFRADAWIRLAEAAVRVPVRPLGDAGAWRRMFQLNHNRSPAECLAKMDELLRQYELSVSKGKHVAGQPLINNLAPLHEHLTYAAANATAAPTAHGLVLRGDSDDAAEAARNRKRRRSESDDDVLTQLVSYMKQDQAAAVAREEHLRAQIRDANSLRDFLLTVLSQVTSALVSLPQNKAVLGSLPPEAAQFLREGINLEAQSSGHLVSPMTQAQVVSRARDAVPQVTHADFKKAKEKVMYKKKESVPDGLYM
ncbi:hypothetical protein EJB05_38660, partial [Eragrostis curvula]